jgi:hypothetical protein
MNTATTERVKLIGYATKLVVIFNYGGNQHTEDVYCEGESVTKAQAAAKIERIKQLAVPGTIRCYTAGTFPVTKPLKG